MSDIGQLAPGSHLIDIEGVDQVFHVFGQGRVCIAHPGGPGVGWSYLRMPELEEHLTMVYLEPIGTGASGRLESHPAGYDVQRYSRQLNAFLKALNLRDVLLLGHSHGGFVVQDVALRHPERVAGLILYDTSAITGPEFMAEASRNIDDFVARNPDARVATAVREAWAAIPAMQDDADYLAVMRGLWPAYFGEAADPDLVERTRAGLSVTFVSGDGAPFDVRAALGGMETPALVLVGDSDFICGPPWAGVLRDSIPNSRQVVFKRCGHLAHIEQPDAFATAVTDFVRALSVH